MDLYRYIKIPVHVLFRAISARISQLSRTIKFAKRISAYYQVLLLVFLLLIIGGPIFYLTWGSFWTTTPGLGGEFTLEGYQQLIAPGTVETFWNTLIVATVGSIVALVMGLGGVILTTKTNTRLNWLIGPIFLIQYFLPSYILALSWRIYAGPRGPLNQLLLSLPFINKPPIDIFSVWGIAVVSGASYAGIVYLLTKGAIQAVPAVLEETAQLAGAPLRKTLSKVTLRLALPSILITFVIVFSRLLQSFGTPLILGVRGDVYVLATELYTAIRGYPLNFKFGAALGVILLIVAAIGVWAQRHLMGSREKYETVAGQGEIAKLDYQLGFLGKILSGLFLLLVALLYIIPLLVLIMSSFQGMVLGLKFEYVNWTLENYQVLFTGQSSDRFWTAIKNTLLISGIGGAFGMVIAVMASYIIVKNDSRLSKILDILTFVPVVLPGIVIGMAYLWFFLHYNVLGLYGTIWLIMIAFTAKFLVYGTRAANSSFRSIGSEIEEAAVMSGAGLYTRIKRIYAPLVKPGIVSGYAILFVDYMKSLPIPLLLDAGDSSLIQVLLWRSIANGEPEQAAAISTIIILLILSIYGLGTFFTDYDMTKI